MMQRPGALFLGGGPRVHTRTESRKRGELKAGDLDNLERSPTVVPLPLFVITGCLQPAGRTQKDLGLADVEYVLVRRTHNTHMRPASHYLIDRLLRSWPYSAPLRLLPLSTNNVILSTYTVHCPARHPVPIDHCSSLARPSRLSPSESQSPVMRSLLISRPVTECVKGLIVGNVKWIACESTCTLVHVSF